MADEAPFKPVIWVGSSRKDLRDFPEPVQDQMGYALYVAQRDGRHRDTKAGDTSFRAVYTLRYAGAVYVLHAFQKKSKTGRETPQRDMELIGKRLREAEQIAREGRP